MSQAVLQKGDMVDDKQRELLKLADDLMEKTGNPIKVASHLRDEMNKRYGPAWQCVVGRDFSSFITFEKGTFTEFMIGDYDFVVFKWSKKEK
ncbi:hypothetical protein CRM22_002920 [Opisthorchis felineus]|uniref:Dynein light chain n=1 Tax=Opisthorchis felineus TaxID=147828 RepID=A0A4S2M9T0_OPIFE|nr:hypothetical protein CRM22_002920 [Opisthorchis felineus]